MSIRPTYALICDDHPVVGRGLSELLKEHPLIQATVVTSSVQQCLEYLAGHPHPAIVIADFWMQGDTTCTLVTELKKMQLPVLMISADDDPMVQIRCQEWGADGFISKQASPGVLREAVSSLIQGLGWFMPLAQKNHDALDVNCANRIPVSARELGLTRRQGEVFAAILQGKPNKRIAQQLCVTEATVKEHITGIFQRLGAKTRVELITKFQNRRLIV